MSKWKFNDYTLPGLPAEWNQITFPFGLIIRGTGVDDPANGFKFWLVCSGEEYTALNVDGTYCVAIKPYTVVHHFQYIRGEEDWVWVDRGTLVVDDMDSVTEENLLYYYFNPTRTEYIWCNESIKNTSNAVIFEGSDPILVEDDPEPEEPTFNKRSFWLGVALGLAGKGLPPIKTAEPVEYPVLAERDSWYKSETPRYSITEINIVDSYTPTGTETESWAADTDETGSIMCYIDGTVLTIAGNGSGRIKLSADASNMFNNSSGDTMNRFTDVISINGFTLFDTSDVTNMSTMFAWCEGLTSVDLSCIDTSNVTNMISMFQCTFDLTSIDLSSFDTSNVTNMEWMFVASGVVSLDLSSFDTSKVISMWRMFDACVHLTSVNLSSFNTSNVVQMSGMFDGCKSLTTLDLRNFDTSSVKSGCMNSTFDGCKNLTSILVGDGWTETGYESNTFRNCGVSSVTYV